MFVCGVVVLDFRVREGLEATVNNTNIGMFRRSRKAEMSGIRGISGLILGNKIE